MPVQGLMQQWAGYWSISLIQALMCPCLALSRRSSSSNNSGQWAAFQQLLQALPESCAVRSTWQQQLISEYPPGLAAISLHLD